MRLPFLQLSTLLSLASPILADADFASVHTNLDWSRSAVDPSNPDKYFHEAGFNPHYDGRFGSAPLAIDRKQQLLRTLIQTFLSTMDDLGIETWLMHGTLLGWYWNRKILPWDSDLDVMVGETGLWYLAHWHNLTVWNFEVPEVEPRNRRYLLEINPHCWNGTVDKENAIDARWIDTEVGLYIDITTLRRNETQIAEGIEGAMMVKDRHHYLYDDIFPLRETDFEGVKAKVPFAYADVLVEEYHEESLTSKFYEHHKFDEEKRVWVPTKTFVPPPVGRPVSFNVKGNRPERNGRNG